MIYIRHRYTGQPEFTYAIGAWIARPYLSGPNPTIQVEDDSRLQEVLDRAHAKFGTPGEALHIPDKLPTPSARSMKSTKRGAK